MTTLTEAKDAFIAAVRDYLSEFEGGVEHLVQNAEERMASFVSDIENTTRGWAKKVEHVAEEIVEEVREEVREIIGEEASTESEPQGEQVTGNTADGEHLEAASSTDEAVANAGVSAPAEQPEPAAEG